MPRLKLIKGSGSWKEHRIDSGSVLIGRDRQRCRAVLSEDSVSRQHAEIVVDKDEYFIIDHDSKSGTKLNGKRLNAHRRYPLQNRDLIQICSYALTFLDDSTTSDSSSGTKEVDDDDSSGFSSVLDSSSNSWALRTSINPEAKLKAIMDLSENLRHSESLENLLWNVLGSLLRLFCQPNHGVVVLTKSKHKPSVSRVVRHRTDDDKLTVIMNQTLIAHVDNEVIAPVSEDYIAGVVNKQISMISEDECIMCAPLVDSHDQSLGAIQLDARDETGRFTRDDLDLLATITVEVSFAVENWILREVALHEQQLQLELQVANEVQIGLLPSSPPEIEGYNFYDYYSPAKQVGGDYFDYLQLENNKLAFVLGDVSGKGVPAALLMAKLSGEMSVYLASGLGPKDVLERVNPLFKKRSTGGRFVTLVLAVIDLTTNEIALVNAGHMPPLLRREDGGVVEIGGDSSGMPLGIYPVQHYEEFRFILDKGEVLVLYSDGVTEALSVSGELYGLDRLRTKLSISSNTAPEIGACIMSDLHEFVGDQQQSDDICLLCLNRNR